MKMIIPLIAIALMICIIPSAMGVIKTVDCLNDNTLRKYTNLTYCNATGACIDYNLTEYVNCIYGCDDARMICTDYSGDPGVAVPMILFIIFELIAFGLLALSFVSDETLFKLISSVMAAILLFSLGLLATNIMTDQGAVQIIWLSWFNIFMGWIGIIMFIAAMFYMFKDSKEEMT